MKAIRLLALTGIAVIYLAIMGSIIWFNTEKPKDFGLQMLMCLFIGYWTNPLLKWWEKFWEDKA